LITGLPIIMRGLISMYWRKSMLRLLTF